MSLKKVFLVLFLLAFSGCSETFDSFYANIDAVRRDGAIDRGWIPNILPNSAQEIYERHNIDSNRVWMRFKFDSGDAEILTQTIKEVNPEKLIQIKLMHPGITAQWWHKKLKEESFKNGTIITEFKIYEYDNFMTWSDGRKEEIASYFAIDWKSYIAYYWQDAI